MSRGREEGLGTGKRPPVAAARLRSLRHLRPRILLEGAATACRVGFVGSRSSFKKRMAHHQRHCGGWASV